jgi:eukaryotic-like serine/threonine-protein kinase
LTTLVEREGAVVSREELRQRLWPDHTFVDFDKSLGVAVTKLRRVLGDDAASPRFIETVPRHGYRFIASVQAPALPAPRRSKLAYAVAISFVVVAAAAIGSLTAGLWHSPPSTRPPRAVSPVRARRSVAVLGFRNLPGRREEDWLSEAFAEMLSTELAAGGTLRLIPDEDVARVKRELPLGNEESLGRETLGRLRTNPGADAVVLGSYTPMPGKDGSRVRLDVRLQDTATGETILERAVVGAESDIFEIAARAGADLRQSLGAGSASPDDVVAARASLPGNEEAIRLYSQGNARLWAFDFVGARDALGKAVDADPAFPLAHAALSDAWGHLGYRTKAVSEARRALDLSRRLPREEHLLVEAQYQRTVGDWPKAVKTYRSLFALRPDSLDCGLRLAVAEAQVDPADALRTLGRLRALPPPARGDPRIDLVEASAQIGRDLGAAQAAAKRAVARGEALGSHLVVARAYGILCQQGPNLGTSGEASIGYCETARRAYASSGDYNNEARTLSDLAGIFSSRAISCERSSCGATRPGSSARWVISRERRPPPTTWETS